MRLSDAIRLGAMIRPQAFFGLFKDGGSCALGAALEAIRGDEADMEGFLHQFSDTAAIGVVLCPGCEPGRRQYGPLDAVVAHLNDFHRWSRERIADWVASCEPPITPPDAPAAIGLSVEPLVGGRA
jgi:hypothetical protein